VDTPIYNKLVDEYGTDPADPDFEPNDYAGFAQAVDAFVAEWERVVVRPIVNWLNAMAGALGFESKDHDRA